MMFAFAANLFIALLIGVPLNVWLSPPWYASFSIGVAAYCLASASVRR